MITFCCLTAIAGAVIQRALALKGQQLKSAAIDMGMDPGQASRQLSGEARCHLDRWIAVPGLAPYIGVAIAELYGVPEQFQAIEKLRMARMALAREASAEQERA